jgi:CubicO group peptidase (beta-lactamase class C family)
MYKRFTLVILLAVVLLAVVFPIQALQEEDDPITRIDNALNSMVDRNSFSGLVLIARDGEILLNKGYGLANREWGIVNTPDTKFRIGWLSMQFTAMATLILQERDLLTVEDPICQYFEECPEAWVDITIHHLLTHTSGIPDFTALRDYRDTIALRTTPEQLIERFSSEPLIFDPGESFFFSNSDYVVLGYIIEQVSGDSYQRFLDKNIFEPLGMENSGYDISYRILEHRAEGYASAYRKADFVHESVLYAVGGLYSTTEDMYLWDQALFGGQVVSQESWDAMVEAAFPVADPSMEWVKAMYGLFMWSKNGHIAVAHGSFIDGFGGQMSYYADDDLTIIILSNLEMYPFQDSLIFADILFRD